jgi:hypothetical protein
MASEIFSISDSSGTISKLESNTIQCAAIPPIVRGDSNFALGAQSRINSVLELVQKTHHPEKKRQPRKHKPVDGYRIVARAQIQVIAHCTIERSVHLPQCLDRLFRVETRTLLAKTKTLKSLRCPHSPISQMHPTPKDFPAPRATC